MNERIEKFKNTLGGYIGGIDVDGSGAFLEVQARAQDHGATKLIAWL